MQAGGEDVNELGTRFRIGIFGSSHGPCVGAKVEGCPPGSKVSEAVIQAELDRRSPGRGPLSTARRERDRLEIVSGLRNGRATGGPIVGLLRNMDADSSAYDAFLKVPRPGHADYPAMVRYGGHHDHRGGGQFSGRMTAGLVIGGAIARQVIERKGVGVLAQTVQIGSVKLDKEVPFSQAERIVRSNAVGCADKRTAELMKQEIVRAHEDRDSVGGVVKCTVIGLPVGIGEPFFGSIESLVSSMMFSIPGVKGVEFGSGFRCASMRGSEHNDPYIVRSGKIVTKTNNAGGVLGGLSNGMPVEFRVAFKPTSSIARPQMSVDLETKKQVELMVKGRHDPCIVPRAVPVVENSAAAVMLDLMLQGGFC
ncbi:MAG: chorismate synthase [Euryarchaeota archaeon RBG_16_62_10]|nr:MAG: chorismate synthase [Euryarchaeota archaeon RBG_16_62_10]